MNDKADEILERINHDILNCGPLRFFRVRKGTSPPGFVVEFYFKKVAEFSSLSDLILFLENLERALDALKDYY